MNPHQTCGTCLHNVAAVCSNEAWRYHGSPLKAWNTCSAHTAPTPTKEELLAGSTRCAAALEHLSGRSGGDDYAEYWHERAAQCRSWAARLQAGETVDVEDITAGLREFEEMSL